VALILIKNVLVAVDGSENSKRALDFALDFTDKFNAHLTIMNVNESSTVVAVPPQLAAYNADNSMVVVARDMQRYHQDILDNAVNYAKATNPNLTISTNLREGNPAAEIVMQAKDGNFDVVIVGHRGSGKVREFLLGSISEKVVHSLGCTVIIVR
jgi:nucleotide-binding universal stress UspA family protein